MLWVGMGAAWVALAALQAPLGYGTDMDAWGLARAGEMIWEQSRYIVSRTTGFPLYELYIAPFVGTGGWTASNLATSLFGLVILAVLAALARAGSLRHPALTAPALLFAPLVVVNGASTMDYVPALALLLLAYLALVRRRWLLAAALVGAAVGLRPSSGLQLLPLLLAAWRGGVGLRGLFAVAGTGLGWALLAYSPVLLTHGVMHPFHAPMDLTTRLLYAGYHGQQLFGLAATLGLALLAAAVLVRRPAGRVRRELTAPEGLYHAATLLLAGGSFLILPHEAGYLLVAGASFLLLLERLLTRRQAWIMLLLVLSYHVVSLEPMGGRSGERRIELSLSRGYTLEDIAGRRFSLAFRAAAEEYAPEQPTLFMYGWYYAALVHPQWELVEDARNIYRRRGSRFYLSGRITELDALRELHRAGVRVVAWEGKLGEYPAQGVEGWRELVEVVSSFEEVFGRPLHGAPPP